MLAMIWGYKTEAIFDVWTFEHFIGGVSIGSCVLIYNNKGLFSIFSSISKKLSSKKINFLKYKHDITLLLLLAYSWETVEHYLEAGLVGGKVTFWFQGVEFWANRIISDPLMLILGYLFVKRFPLIMWPARIFSVIWFFVHIFIFPHCMYLHEIF